MLASNTFFEPEDIAMLLPNILCYWVIFCIRFYPLFSWCPEISWIRLHVSFLIQWVRCFQLKDSCLSYFWENFHILFFLLPFFQFWNSISSEDGVLGQFWTLNWFSFSTPLFFKFVFLFSPMFWDILQFFSFSHPKEPLFLQSWVWFLRIILNFRIYLFFKHQPINACSVFSDLS